MNTKHIIQQNGPNRISCDCEYDNTNKEHIKDAHDTMKNEFLFVVGFVSNVVFEETDGVEYYIPVAYSLIEAYTQKKSIFCWNHHISAQFYYAKYADHDFNRYPVARCFQLKREILHFIGLTWSGKKLLKLEKAMAHSAYPEYLIKSKITFSNDVSNS